MARGDRRSRKGKIAMGLFGKTRPRRGYVKPLSEYTTYTLATKFLNVESTNFVAKKNK